MDMRDLLGKLDTLNEGTMAAAKKKPTGPKHTGKWKGTDPASAAKTKYVGGESLLRDLEAALHETPTRDLMREYKDFIKEAPVVPQQQSNKPTLGTDLTKPGTPQQQQQQDPAQVAAQQKLAQQEKIEQNNLQKGVADLKAAGAAVSNPAQVVKAFDKVDDQQALTPADKGAVATAGTVLAPIMANTQLQGKFKDLVAQASAEQKKQQQQQQAAAPAGAVGAPVPGQK
jgi:hypothetical protein